MATSNVIEKYIILLPYSIGEFDFIFIFLENLLFTRAHVSSVSEKLCSLEMTR